MPINVLPQKAGLGEMLGLGLGQGVNQGVDLYLKNKASQSQNQLKHFGKIRENASKDVNSFLKNYNAAYSDNEKIKKQIYDNYLNIINEAEERGQLIDKNLAMDMAIGSFENSPEQVEQKNKKSTQSFFEDILQNKNSPASRAPFKERYAQQQADREEMYQKYKGEPASKAFGFLQGLGELAEKLTGGTVSNQIDKQLNQLLGIETAPLVPNESEQQKTNRELFKDIGTTVGETALMEAVPLGKAFQSIKNSKLGKFISEMLLPKAGSELAGTAKKATQVFENLEPFLNAAKAEGAGAAAAKAGSKTAAESIKARAPAKEPSQKLKEAVVRTERSSPEARLFKTEKEIALREKQLKDFPKYEAEISKDAETRLAKLKEKGPIAKATQAQKMAHYEKEVPKVQDLYEKSAARVRALESAIVESGADKTRLRPLLDAAKNEMQESEYLLRQTINNAKTGEARVGFDKMKASAQNKVLEIQNKIAEGEAVTLAKKDYSPEFIKEAKELGKRKPLIAKKQSDYFTQVHDGYAQVYKNRIAQIDKELGTAEKSLQGLHKRQQLAQEKATLEKMVEHANAENTIHRHKMALREIAERKKATERLAQISKTPIKAEKASKISGEALKKQPKFNAREGAKEAVTGSKKSSEKIIDDAVKNAAEKSKTKASQILKEKDELVKAFNNAKENTTKSQSAFSEALNQVKNEPTKENSNKLSAQFIEQLKDYKNLFTGKGEGFFKTQTGKDFITGFIIDSLENIYFEASGEKLPNEIKSILKVPVTITTDGKLRLSPSKSLGQFLSDKIYNFYKTKKVESALKQGRSQQYSEYKKKYGPTFTKKVIKKVNK